MVVTRFFLDVRVERRLEGRTATTRQKVGSQTRGQERNGPPDRAGGTVVTVGIAARAGLDGKGEGLAASRSPHARFHRFRAATDRVRMLGNVRDGATDHHLAAPKEATLVPAGADGERLAPPKVHRHEVRHKAGCGQDVAVGFPRNGGGNVREVERAGDDGFALGEDGSHDGGKKGARFVGQQQECSRNAGSKHQAEGRVVDFRAAEHTTLPTSLRCIRMGKE